MVNKNVCNTLIVSQGFILMTFPSGNRENIRTLYLRLCFLHLVFPHSLNFKFYVRILLHSLDFYEDFLDQTKTVAWRKLKSMIK